MGIDADYNLDLQIKLSTHYPHKPLKKQRALVTGANSGIGEAVARYLSAAGASVAINYVSNEAATAKIVEEINCAGGQAIGLHADVSQEEQVVEMFSQMKRHFGTIDILVANAGLQKDSKFTEMTVQQWNTVIGVNLTGQFLCVREAIKEFLRRGVVQEISLAAAAKCASTRQAS